MSIKISLSLYRKTLTFAAGCDKRVVSFNSETGKEGRGE
jgi:hypothetical protein